MSTHDDGKPALARTIGLGAPIIYSAPDALGAGIYTFVGNTVEWMLAGIAVLHRVMRPKNPVVADWVRAGNRGSPIPGRFRRRFAIPRRGEGPRTEAGVMRENGGCFLWEECP